MRKRVVIAGLAALLLSLAAFGSWMFTLPAARPAVDPAPVPAAEMDALLTSLKPQEGKRPLVAVVGINDATETTDYLLPTSILRRAGIAEVLTLSAEAGPVRLYPALTVEADTTITEFEARYPQGADYVIVPAMSRDDDPAIMSWLRQQSDKGAIVVAVCAGAKVAAAAGLLDGKRATTHWYYLKGLLKAHPSIDYVADRRIVADGRVATTTGISASVPAMLILIEAIAGRQKAEAVARELGLTTWDVRHASRAFELTRPFASTVLGNVLAFWKRERMGVALQPGMDEASLALTADAWSRTYRSNTVSFAPSAAPVETRNRIRIIPDVMVADWPRQRLAQTASSPRPAEALDQTLLAIEKRYGRDTADVVALQLEYPRVPATGR